MWRTGGLAGDGCNSLENPIGIETTVREHRCFGDMRCNSLENPIGIETSGERDHIEPVSPGCNSLENPIGIETLTPPNIGLPIGSVATHWKTR